MDETAPSFYRRFCESTVNEIPLPDGVVNDALVPCLLTLYDYHGNSWRVQADYVDIHRFDLCLRVGWIEFVMDVGLKEGEMIVFTKVREFRFAVAIYENCCERDVLPNMASNIRGPGPLKLASFCRLIRKDEDNRRFLIPQEFVEFYEEVCAKESIILTTGYSDGTWELNIERSNNVKISMADWNKFRVDNEILSGDLVIFRVLRFDGNKWNASVYNANGFRVHTLAVGSSLDESSTEQSLPAERSQFVRMIKKHTIVHRLDLPKEFVQTLGVVDGFRFDLVGVGDDLLEATVGECDNHGGKRHYIEADPWMEFVQKNNLRVGDIVLFKGLTTPNGNGLIVEVLDKRRGKDLLKKSGRGGMLSLEFE